MNLHERIAAALGWTVRETEGFSLAALRELVPEKLAREISSRIVTGSIVATSSTTTVWWAPHGRRMGGR